jgi:hypothetical protein
MVARIASRQNTPFAGHRRTYGGALVSTGMWKPELQAEAPLAS